MYESVRCLDEYGGFLGRQTRFILSITEYKSCFRQIGPRFLTTFVKLKVVSPTALVNLAIDSGGHGGHASPQTLDTFLFCAMLRRCNGEGVLAEPSKNKSVDSAINHDLSVD